jgi:hypothetical protein
MRRALIGVIYLGLLLVAQTEYRSVSELLSHADRLHGQPVAVSGTMTNIREIVSHRGYRRYSFDLTDGTQTVKVLAYDLAPCRSGPVKLEGVFEQGKREGKVGYDKIVASSVVCLSDPSKKSG